MTKTPSRRLPLFSAIIPIFIHHPIGQMFSTETPSSSKPFQEKAMRKNKIIRPRSILVLALGIGAAVFALAVYMQPVAASQPSEAALSPKTGEADAPDNSVCTYCHNNPNQSVTLASGEQFALTIDAGHYSESAHNGLACTDCHTDIKGYPHPELTFQTQRAFSLQMYTVCQKCHEEQYNKTLDSVHMQAVAAGNTNAAICTDCHNPHTQKIITDQSGALLPEARLNIPQLCAKCHSTIYNQYQESVHGAALTEEGNTDVPTCIDCHGVHDIGDPTTSAFRLNSPQICAKCHTNASIMDKYGISTQVLNTYVADFHGTTVTLFQKTSPDQATNKPVCFDCHGVHNIMPVDDPVYGLEMKQNLLLACQRCHPDATANFPDAWMSHYIPSPDHYSLVYYVNLFYKFFIPAVIGGMGVFVLSDIVRRLIERFKGAKHS
jgi:nitrate/TMAO reductase-like tetraheme cytochrome c subunit